MLDKVIHFSIHNKLIVGVLTIALIILGAWSATQLPIDAVPDITNNQVQIITTSPSLSAQEVERLITFPVEMQMANIPGLEEVRSISRFGLSVVTVVFTDETEIYWARQQVSERLSLAIDQIPSKIGTPKLAPVTSGLGEIYQYTLHAKKGYESKYSAMELRTIQDWLVRRQLLGTQGVAEVSSFGGYLKQYEIAIEPEKLRSMNISIEEIFNALEANNQNTGGAYIDKNPNAWFIRTEGLTKSINDIEQIVVKNTSNGTPILIKNVAKVQFGHAIRYGAMTYNNEGEVVGAVVMMLKGDNSNQVIANLKSRIEQIKKTLPEGVEIEAFLDRTHLVNRAIQTVSKNLIEGALIVIFVLVLFLGNVRAGLVVASVIPLAMLFAITLMNWFGVSGNLMSLGAIDFGLIVDGAVIIVEATLHHIVSKRYNHRLTSNEMNDEVYESASKIRSSAAFGEIIILIVYLPILALVGVEGKMFKPMAQTVAFAILGAFILSLTYVPMISSLFLSKEPSHKRNISDRMMDFFQRNYTPILKYVIRKKKVVITVALLLFFVSIGVFINLGGEFIPTLDEGDFAVETRVLTGSSMQQTVEAALKASEILTKQFPDEVIKVIGKIGSSEIPTDPMPLEACDLMIILKDKSEWKNAQHREELADKMQEALAEIPGVSFSFQQPIQMRFNELMTGARQDVAIKIYGEDLDTLTKKAHELGNLISKIEGLKDLYIEEVTGLPQIVINYNREKIAQFGLNIDQVNRVVRTAFAGEAAGLVYEGEKRFELVVRLNKQYRQGLSDVQNLYITAASGQQIPLNQLAEVSFKVGPNQIQRDDTKRRIIVAFNVRGRDVESVVNEIQQKVDNQLPLPAGYYTTYGGQFKNLAQAKYRLSIAVPVALFLIFILLYFTFGSIKQSVLIFTAIPLSAIGGIFALWLRDMPFSISAGVGFIALFGVAVLNGIVLIGEFNNLKKEGMTDLVNIVLSGTSTRLRPVSMTATVASLGFLPMALSHGSGAEVQKPLATVVIGGLLSATLLTLLLLPVLYLIFENGVKKMKNDNSGLSTVTIVLACVLFLPLVSKSQTEKTLQQLIQLGIENNKAIKVSIYEVDAQKALKGTSSTLSKTNLGFSYGQFNSYYNDNSFNVSQTIPFPKVINKTTQYYNETIKSAELNNKLTQNELKFQIKSSYYLLQEAKSRHRLFVKQDSIFIEFVKAAELRFNTGEGNVLEKSVAESQEYEIKNKLIQNEADIRILENQLQILCNVKELVTSVSTTDLELRTLQVSLDSAQTANNPMLGYFLQQIKVFEAQKNIEKASLWPDITLGYFNQSLYGTINYKTPLVVADNSTRFQGVNLGLSFNLWSKPQVARIRAADANKNVAEAKYQLYQKNLEGTYKKSVEEYLKYKTSIDFYKLKALPTADLMVNHAMVNYKTGNIGYVEFMQGVTRAIDVKMSYLQTVNQYNQAVIYLEYLAGQ